MPSSWFLLYVDVREQLYRFCIHALSQGSDAIHESRLRHVASRLARAYTRSSSRVRAVIYDNLR